MDSIFPIILLLSVHLVRMKYKCFSMLQMLNQITPWTRNKRLSTRISILSLGSHLNKKIEKQIAGEND